MIDPASILPFIFSVIAITFTTWLMLKRRIRKVRLKVPPRVPSLAEMLRTLRHMTAWTLVALAVIVACMFVPQFHAQRNPLVPIGFMLLVAGGLSLYVKAWTVASSSPSD